jgi:hypothetical protein
MIKISNILNKNIISLFLFAIYTLEIPGFDILGVVLLPLSIIDEYLDDVLLDHLDEFLGDGLA